MPSIEQHGDVLRRLEGLEGRLEALEDKVGLQQVVDTEIRADIKLLHTEFTSLKGEVITTVKEHTDRTWQLIDKSWKALMLLLGIILALVGFKELPGIAKLLIG